VQALFGKAAEALAATDVVVASLGFGDRELAPRGAALPEWVTRAGEKRSKLPGSSVYCRLLQQRMQRRVIERCLLPNYASTGM